MALMNRLSYAWKFCLISALCFIPLVVVSGLLVHQAWDRVQASRHALDSMHILRQLVQLIPDAERVRGLDIAAFHLGVGDEGAVLEQRSQEVRQRIISGLQAVVIEGNSAEARELNEQRDALVAAYRETATASLRNRGQMSTQAHVDLLSLLTFSAAYSGLSHDYDRDVRQLMDLLVNHAPQVTSTVGLGRATGAYSIGLGYLNSDASRYMDYVLEEIQRLGGQYVQAQAVLQQPSLQSLRASAAASVESLERVAEIFEEQVILASSFDDTWDDFFQTVTLEMNKTYDFSHAVLDHLQQALDQRLSAGNRSMTLLVTALAVIMVLIIWLYLGFYFSTRQTIGELSLVMRQVAAGDMTGRVRVASRDELGALAQELNGSLERIQSLIQHVRRTSGQVHDQSAQVVSISSESSQAVDAQRNQIEQVAKAMNEMAATSQEVARSAALAATSAEQVNQETLSGRRMVEASVDGIEKLAQEIENSVKVINNLAEDSASISRVLDVIKGVAEQTNLLALNAAIKAARAGEQGRGFAVVADEVRTLAQRTQQSTGEVQSMIDSLQKNSRAAVQVIQESSHVSARTVEQANIASASLEQITLALTALNDLNASIASSTLQQSHVAEEISQNISRVAGLASSSTTAAQQASSSSENLGQLARSLSTLLAQFKV